MNNRIKELVKQASFEETTMTNFIAGPRQIFYGDEAHMQKFAELIIKECAQVSEDDITDGDACCTNTAYRISRQIKKHFGVEE